MKKIINKSFLSNNILIAEFMGWKQRPAYLDTYWKKGEHDRKINSFFYESSWNELMPVVKKIGLLYDTIHLEDRSICELNIFSNIDLVYIHSIQFIKWYLKINKKIQNEKSK